MIVDSDTVCTERACCPQLYGRNDHSEVAPNFLLQISRKVLNLGVRAIETVKC